MKNKIICLLTLWITSPLLMFAQFRQIYLDADSTNEIRNISFITPTEGYVAFENYIGYTQDSGHTFVKKYITINNVNFNGYSVNLTFGFDIKGVHVFSRDSLLVYGDYGFVPSILFTTDGGNSFKLIYNSTLNLTTLNNGITNMVFPENTGIGFAVEINRILRTTDNGMTWNPILNDIQNNYTDIDFLDNANGYAISENGLIKTVNGGSSWQTLTTPPGIPVSLSFITANKGWLVINYSNNSIYYTSDGGNSWSLKNNKDLYPVASPIKFLNDSTGYYVGSLFDTYKTTDSGRIWEPLLRNNDYSYYNYVHNTLFFYNTQTVWAGGGHGFLELSTNGGGTTLPVSKFTVDLSTLNTDSTVRLTNQSKEGYQYQWLKNSFSFANTYNAAYFSQRQSIDTIKLIVQKGSYSDTSQLIIDTRVNTQQCFATFDVKVDTSAVKCTPGYQATGVKHYWDFGDGITDSVDAIPVHHYTSVGNYTIIHKVFNTIDKCTELTSSVVTIIRTQSCLSGYFTYAADSFYANTVKFVLHFDSTKESGVYPVISWQFGDGSAGGNPEITVSHVFNSSGYYDVCPVVQNFYTGCVTTFCQPVLIHLADSCNARFLSGGRLPATVTFNGKPYSSGSHKSNTWIIDGHDSTNTGNLENFTKSFYSGLRDNHFDAINNTCGNEYLYQICIDSLNRKMTRVVYDSISLCSSADSQMFTIPTQYAIHIKAVADPSYPYYVSFYAFTGNNPDSGLAYGGVWRIQQGGAYYYTGNYTAASNKLTYTFTNPGNYTVAIGSQSCLDGGNREVYYINYYVAPLACPIYPPSFTYQLYRPGDYKTINFFDGTINQNGGNPANYFIWYFGDGDSSVQPLHTYASYGIYNVTLKYMNTNGCSKQITQEIVVEPPCTISVGFIASRDTARQSRIIFINTTTADSAATYKWYFGNGDSSSEKDPVYFYTMPGKYHVQLISSNNAFCTSSHDTTVNISDTDICNLNAGFSAKVVDNTVYFTNTSLPSSSTNNYNWDFGDGTYSTDKAPIHKYYHKGTYRVCLSAKGDTLCGSNFCDSVAINVLESQNLKVIPNPVTSTFTVQYVSDVFGQVTIEILEASGTTLLKINEHAIAGINNYNLNADNLQKGYYIVKVTDASGKKVTSSFLKM
ncbi:MAG TPA: PKD domain-containing protein [Hanamia sp.]